MSVPFTLSEIESRISRFGGPPDFDTEQALSYAIALTEGKEPIEAPITFEIIGRAVQFRPRFCEYADPHDGVCFLGEEQVEELCSFERSQRCTAACWERVRVETLVHDYDEPECPFDRVNIGISKIYDWEKR